MDDTRFLNAIRDFFGLPTRRAARFFLVYCGYFLLINIISYLAMRLDKKRARRGLKRIPENVLFSLAILGGSFGIYAAMRQTRHKVKKRKFTIVIPPLTFINLLIFIVFVYCLY